MNKCFDWNKSKIKTKKKLSSGWQVVVAIEKIVMVLAYIYHATNLFSYTLFISVFVYLSWWCNELQCGDLFIYVDYIENIFLQTKIVQAFGYC